MSRGRRPVRSLVVSLALLALAVGFAASSSEACETCSVGLCIPVQAGYDDCIEQVIVVWGTIYYECQVSGSCGGGGMPFPDQQTP